jgi:hypothetical protein
MILSFDKPKKVRSADEHNAMHSSDSGVDGTYVPNMSAADMKKWKAKRIGGDDPRIEIRKTISGKDPSLAKRNANRGYYGSSGNVSAQVLIIVRKDRVVMSTNGRIAFDAKTWLEFIEAVNEAATMLQEKK